MRAYSTRVFLGCIAGALAMLVFHQMTMQVCFWLGWAPHAAYRVAHVGPFNAPLVVSITFWGAVYGGLFGLIAPAVRGPLWAKGMLAGVCAMVLAWFVFLPLMGQRPAFGFEAWPMLRSFIAYQMWGLGMTLMLRLLLPRPLHGRRRDWEASRIAA